MAGNLRKITAAVLALLLCMSLCVGGFANNEELMEYELLDVPLFCKTDFYEYISEEEAVVDLAGLAKDLGYKSDGEGFTFTESKQKLSVSLDEKVTEDGYKICKSISYGVKKDSIQCTFEREDRYDGSTLYSVNVPGSYTVSMDQILLLTYIMENLSKKNTDPLADLYKAEYWISDMYRFPM